MHNIGELGPKLGGRTTLLWCLWWCHSSKSTFNQNVISLYHLEMDEKLNRYISDPLNFYSHYNHYYYIPLNLNLLYHSYYSPYCTTHNPYCKPHLNQSVHRRIWSVKQFVCSVSPSMRSVHEVCDTLVTFNLIQNFAGALTAWDWNFEMVLNR